MRIIRVCLAAAALVPCAAAADTTPDEAIARPAVSFLNAADGLPSEAVETIVQDRLGYLWIGTRGGLVRHDGHRLTVLRHDPDRADSLPGNNVMSMLAARDGSVWAGISDQGLVRLRGRSVERHWPSAEAGGELPGRFIWSIAEGCDGWIWLAFARGGLARVHSARNSIETWPAGDPAVPDDGFNLELRIGPDCHPWLMTLTTLYRSKSADAPDFHPVRQPDGEAIEGGIVFEFVDSDALVVAGQGGTRRFRRHADRWRLEASAPVDGTVTALAVAPDRSLWLAEPGRVARWEAGAAGPEVVIRTDSSAAGEPRLAGLLIASIGVDAEGGVWIGTSGRGLARLSPAWRGFRHIPYGGPLALSRIERMAADPAGGAWLLDSQRGLQHLDPDGRIGELHAAARLGRAHDLRDVVASADGLRLLTDRRMIHYRPDRGERTVHYEADGDVPAILRFLEAGDDDRFWLGSERELIEIDAGGDVIRRWSQAELEGTGLSESALLDVERGPDARWWLLGRRTIARQDRSGNFRIIHRAERALNDSWLFDGHDLWVAGDSLLQRFSIDGAGLRLEDRFVAGNGLPPGRIQRMFAYKGSIWLLMTTGLSRLEPESGRFRVFSAHEGLPTVRFQASGALATDDGFLAATTDGVLRVVPDLIDGSVRPPPVHLTSVRAGDRRWTLPSGPRQELELAWYENSIEFEFVALSFLNPHRNRFRVRLSGWEDDWYEDTGMSRRYFGNLSPGRYRFEVQAANAAGRWNRVGDAVDLRIAPPPWRAAPALAAYLMVGLVAVGGSGMAWRRRQLRSVQRRRARDQRELVDAQRKVLARLTRSLEPEALRQAIVQVVQALTHADRVEFRFLHPGFPRASGVAGSTESDRATDGPVASSPGGRHVFELRGERGALAEIAIEGDDRLRRPEIRSRLALLRATSAQLLDQSLSLVDGRRLAEAAENASAAKSDFVATVSHEIRTPLHALSGMLAMLRETRLDGEQADIVETLARSTWQLRGLLDEVLDLSRIEAREIRIEPRPFELVPMLERIVDLHAANAHRKGLALRLRIHPDLPNVAMADALRLGQILGNLLSNAVKFTVEGAVELEARAAGGALVCSVTDTGPGIPSSARARMFEPFEQASPSMTRRAGGVGLGLAICRRLAAAMGGRIEVGPRRLGGSRFVVEIPDVLVLTPGATPTPTPVGGELLRGCRVAVDVEPTDRRALLWLARRWQLQLVRPPSDGRDWAGITALIHDPGRCADAKLEQAREAGCRCLCLCLSPEPPRCGSGWLRAPLNESRSVGALIDAALAAGR
ncbi:hybrid sensor histidine kinase/response regulator [Halomonas denitrificans]|nr:hypothetical protein [Halomonas denitrificans]